MKNLPTLSEIETARTTAQNNAMAAGLERPPKIKRGGGSYLGTNLRNLCEWNAKRCLDNKCVSCGVQLLWTDDMRHPQRVEYGHVLCSLTDLGTKSFINPIASLFGLSAETGYKAVSLHPLTKNNLPNLAPQCRRCNGWQDDMSLVEWIDAMGDNATPHKNHPLKTAAEIQANVNKFWAACKSYDKKALKIWVQNR